MAQRQAVSLPHRLGFAATLRIDPWWLETLIFMAGLVGLFGYLAVSAFLDQWAFHIGPYYSPVFEPGPFMLLEDKLDGPFGPWFLSPAFVILWGPAGFRLTCYYFRKAYYRALAFSPPACAVGDALPRYRGESRLPLIVQNLHRYFMYVALVLVWFQWANAIRSFHHPDEGWGVGLGSIILTVDSALLSLYLFSCHALRHLVGGGIDCFSCSRWHRLRKRGWDVVSRLNLRHPLWAWLSLMSVAAADIYIRLVANGTITDPNTWRSL
jgi:hypothetical protein